MTRSERETLRARFQFRCGYCGVSETDVGALLTVDHFQPQSRGGADDSSNWIYCCSACNSFKSNYWPLEPTQHPLLNPLTDDFSAHLEEREGRLFPLTPVGENHIQLLHRNREALVAHRLDKQEQLQSARQLREALELAERNRLLREAAEAELERWLQGS